MQIGVDATCWHNNRGYGRHARALLGALARLDTENRYTFFLDADEGSPPETLLRSFATNRARQIWLCALGTIGISQWLQLETTVILIPVKPLLVLLPDPLPFGFDLSPPML